MKIFVGNMVLLAAALGFAACRTTATKDISVAASQNDANEHTQPDAAETAGVTNFGITASRDDCQTLARQASLQAPTRLMGRLDRFRCH